jgi:DNA-binding protein H-NS
MKKKPDLAAINAEIKRLEAEAAKLMGLRNSVRPQVIAAIKLYQFTAEELGLVAKGKPPKPAKPATDKNRLRGPQPMRYQDPGNPERQWSGTGKPPGWFKALIAGGVSKESLLIKTAG